MKKLLEHILKNLVDQSDKVVVKLEESDEEIGVDITVDESDLGRVIGKQGRTINAIRCLAKVLSTKEKKRLKINLQD